MFLNFKGKFANVGLASNQQFCDTVTSWQVANGSSILFRGYSTSEKSILPKGSVSFSDVSNIVITYNFCSKIFDQPISFELCEFNDKSEVINFDERKTVFKKQFKTNDSNSFVINKNDLPLLKYDKTLTFVLFYGEKHHYLGQLRITK